MFKKFFAAKSPSPSKAKRKKRISPTSGGPDGMAQVHPMYQYAMNEYAQTVAPATSNDDGHSIFAGLDGGDEEMQTPQQQQLRRQHYSQLPDDHDGAAAGTSIPPGVSQTGSLSSSAVVMPQPSSVSRAETDLRSRGSQLSPPSSDIHSHYAHFGGGGGFVGTPQLQPSAPMSPQAQYVLTEVSTPLPSPPNMGDNPHHQQHKSHNTSQWPSATSAAHEPAMPDATYEEYYGDAYVGGPIRYIYPSGYQSMRPRSGPWKLSIVVCLMMSWLSVFIIGHCSDRVDQSLYNQNEIDDDTYAIDIRWCGSRLLYWMWVLSMLITGIATAYCSVIGYIKVRDFAVGNMRSQPPGMVGKSDYYVQIQRDGDDNNDQYYYYKSGGGDGGDTGSSSSSTTTNVRYQKTIYQADGTPQFWGHHIYRPTQAAVAITSR